MPTIAEVASRLLPSRIPGHPAYASWRECPPWPADVFAVAAKLVNMSGCYADERYADARKDKCFFSDGYIKKSQKIGARWAKGHLPREVRSLWQTLVGSNAEVTEGPEGGWKDAAIQLIAIADEAARGFGFVPPEDQALPFASLLHSEYVRWASGRTYKYMPYLPNSVCLGVPPSEVCVQPKSRTPQVGCSLRSLTHNLALLPSVGEVRSVWRLGAPSDATEGPLNLLLIPYPYHLVGQTFRPSTNLIDESVLYFTIHQDWLCHKNRQLQPAEIGQFICELIENAKGDTGRIHGVVLPECALDDAVVEPLAKYLAKATQLELFVSGLMSRPQSSGGLPRNSVYSCIFSKQRLFAQWKQHKHHRWRVDGSQITRYNLGNALAPGSVAAPALWWENIDISKREVTFRVFRDGASLAVLICEDLARVDPIQPVVRAVGPNLVIALLQDGPQWERRWPGRYATTLADDPGSAVLTLTSLGMVCRSVPPGEAEPRTVALWKDPYGRAQELVLPPRAHGLVLTISSSYETNCTLDRRPDYGATACLSLSGVRAVTHPSPPKWVEGPSR